MGYIVLFALQVFWLVSACRKHKKIWPVMVCNVLSIGLSLGLLWYFDNLPGYGMMPGLSYFTEVFTSLIAAAAFCVLTLVTFFCWLYNRKK